MALERQYPIVLVGALAVLLASYHYFVRSTRVGEVLNGRRYPRRLESLAGSPL